MARRPRKARPSPSGALDLALTEPGARATALGRERDRLMREIRRRRAELARAAREIDAVVAPMRAAVGPVVEQQRDLRREIHALFVQLLAAGRGGKRRQAQVRSVCARFVRAGLVDPMPAGDDIPPGNGDPHVGDFEDASFPPPGERAGATVPSAPRRAHDGNHGTLRALFKRLVVALHPDRTRNEGEKVRRTAAMKDVTSAYESGDLARLIELEKLFADGSADATDRREATPLVEVLERTIAELKAQLRSVLDELRALRRSEVFCAVRDMERFERAGGDPLGAALAEERERLAHLVIARDFVAAFHAGKMTLAEFLEGPSFPSKASGAEADFEDLVDELLTELEPRTRPASRRGQRRREADPNPF